ncbi:MAG TPA: hypothetical protein VEB59_02250, partial [Gemmatimonadales bacterium]|nr:hypothetical protein [Gemmatimonadales bacterium]
MPDPREIGPAYTALLLETRRRGFRLTAQAVAQLEAALREVARRIEDELAAGDTPLTEARAVSLRRQILALLEAFQGQVVRSTVRSVGLTIDQLLALHQQVTDRLAREFLGAAIPGIAGRFDQLAIRAAGVLAARSSNAAAFRTLIRRHIEEAAPALDRLLIGAVARGVSVRRLTRDVAELLRTAVADSPLRDYGLA